MTSSTHTIYTDGAAKGNPGPAGWCWWAGPDSWASGGWAIATNNVAELTAAQQALVALEHDPHTPLVIVTDSRYVIDCLTKYIKGWMRNGWMTSKKAPVANAELIRKIHSLAQARTHPVQWEWLKGHSGAFGNTQADEGASNAALAHQYQRECPTGPGWNGPKPRPGTTEERVRNIPVVDSVIDLEQASQTSLF